MKECIYNDDELQYLEMMQGNIERMASNSANCKAWMVTIVAALMALQCTSIGDLNGWLLLGTLPVVLFWYLDVFYLHLERGMRNRERDFLNKMEAEGDVYKKALFNFAPLMIESKKLTKEQKETGLVATNDRWFSKSVVWFYIAPIIVIVVMMIVTNWSTIIGWFGCNQTM